MRKSWIGVLTSALFFAVVGIAVALNNNTVDYSATLKYTGKATKKAPKSIKYNGVLSVGTSDGKQPNTASSAEIFFAKGLRQNAKKFKSCTAKDIDGKSSIPKKCKAAKVGGGTASASVGSPGGDGTRQDLTVGAYNGKKGKQILLVVSGGPVTNRVIPGDFKKASGAFAFKVVFKVPKELQGILTTQIALTDFNVNIKKDRRIKVTVRRNGKKKRITKKVGYLEITRCVGDEMPVRAKVNFNNDDNTPGGTPIVDSSSTACK